MRVDADTATRRRANPSQLTSVLPAAGADEADHRRHDDQPDQPQPQGPGAHTRGQYGHRHRTPLSRPGAKRQRRLLGRDDRARELGGDQVEVTLRLPPPLEEPLRLDGDGQVWDDRALVAEARAGDVGIAPPDPVALGRRTRRAARRPRLAVPTVLRVRPRTRSQTRSTSTRARSQGRDVFAAPVGGRADYVGAEFVWAALDCPGAYATRRAGSWTCRARPPHGARRAGAPGGRALCGRRVAARQRRAQARGGHGAVSPTPAATRDRPRPLGRASPLSAPHPRPRARAGHRATRSSTARRGRSAGGTRAARAAGRPGDRPPRLLGRCPVRGVVDVARAGRRRSCGAASPATRRRPRVRQLESRRCAAALGRRAVDGEEALAQAKRPQVRAEVDPDALRLDPPAGVTGDRIAARRGRGRDAAAPRRQLHQLVSAERLDDPHVGAPHHPDVLVGRPACVGDVVARDVLQVARDRVEAQPPVRVRVREANRPSRREDAAGHRCRRIAFRSRSRTSSMRASRSSRSSCSACR